MLVAVLLLVDYVVADGPRDSWTAMLPHDRYYRPPRPQLVVAEGRSR